MKNHNQNTTAVANTDIAQMLEEIGDAQNALAGAGSLIDCICINNLTGGGELSEETIQETVDYLYLIKTSTQSITQALKTITAILDRAQMQ